MAFHFQWRKGGAYFALALHTGGNKKPAVLIFSRLAEDLPLDVERREYKSASQAALAFAQMCESKQHDSEWVLEPSTLIA